MECLCTTPGSPPPTHERPQCDVKSQYGITDLVSTLAVLPLHPFSTAGTTDQGLTPLPLLPPPLTCSSLPRACPPVCAHQCARARARAHTHTHTQSRRPSRRVRITSFGCLAVKWVPRCHHLCHFITKRGAAVRLRGQWVVTVCLWAQPCSYHQSEELMG